MSAEIKPEVSPETEPEVEPEPESLFPTPQAETEVEAKPEGEAEAEREAETGYNLTPEPEAIAEYFAAREAYLWISLYSIFILLILAGNLLIIGILLRSSKGKRSATNLFLLSLLLARACIAVFVVPARITGIFSEEYLGRAMCKLCHFCALGSSVTSILSTVCVAVSKYLEIVRKQRDVTVKRTVVLIVVLWVLSYCYASRKLLLTDLTQVELTPDSTIISCAVDASSRNTSNVFIFVDFVTLFTIPFLIIIFCYVKVIKAFKKSKQNRKLSRMQSLADKLKGGERNKETGLQGETVVKDDADQSDKCSSKLAGTGAWVSVVESVKVSRDFLRNAQMLVTITLLFTVCTSVPYIWRLYVFWADKLPANFRDIERAVYLCSYANPWINVLVFFYFRKDIREGLKKVCCYVYDKRATMRVCVLTSTPITAYTDEKY